MLKIFLGILGVILVVALLTNNSSEKTPATVPPSAVMDQQPGTEGVAANTNPAHGQPGHRCDIAVGAPLPSTPASATNTSPVKQPAAEEAVNPPHGQPGHDCAVPVGRPLPKK